MVVAVFLRCSRKATNIYLKTCSCIQSFTSNLIETLKMIIYNARHTQNLTNHVHKSNFFQNSIFSQVGHSSEPAFSAFLLCLAVYIHIYVYIYIY